MSQDGTALTVRKPAVSTVQRTQLVTELMVTVLRDVRAGGGLEGVISL